MLTVTEAKEITLLVARDAESSKRIDSNIDAIIPASWGIAGGLRNLAYVGLWMGTLGHYGDASEPEFANRVCTGISDAASIAINKNVASKEARASRVTKAEPVGRVLNGIDHTAVQVRMSDGQKHIFDWHATLDAANPLLFESPLKWHQGEGGVPLQEFKGWT